MPKGKVKSITVVSSGYLKWSMSVYGCVRHENMEGSSSSRNGNKGPRRLNSPNENLGTYGEYHCDSTWELLESAAKFMKSKQSDNIEFVLWTG
ncbi:hypothetical protein YQE_06862, partial [Dendroctonus ponderosae]